MYITFNRKEWAALRLSTQLLLTQEELNQLQGINENLAIEEVQEVYLPLSRLLNLYVSSSQSLYEVTNTFLGTLQEKVPYVIGIAGSVAVGKSTTARIIQALLAHWPNHPKVDLITTDGFLYPNKVLEEKKLMKKKGFPESYDVRKLLKFLQDIKFGSGIAAAPVYSHITYDIVPDKWQIVNKPDILIVEGLNVLQTPIGEEFESKQPVFISDFFDFTIYVDAKENDIKQWYIERFKLLRNTAFKDKTSYFQRYAELSDEEASETAKRIWEEINAKNLRENIHPTKMRARLILEKDSNHLVKQIKLKKI